MERLVERLEKAVERLETVCEGTSRCGDGSSKGEARGGAAVPDVSRSCCGAGGAGARHVQGCWTSWLCAGGRGTAQTQGPAVTVLLRSGVPVAAALPSAAQPPASS